MVKGNNPSSKLFLKNPKFIAIEGIDGSGKSTLLEKIRSFLASKGKKISILRQPGTTILGENIRTLLKRGDVHPRVAHLLIEAARIECLQLVQKQLKRSDDVVVLADRHFDSTWAYQGAMGVDLHLINHVQDGYIDLPYPEVIIYLDIDPAQARKRRASDRTYFKNIDEDNFDNKPDAFFERVRELYESRIDTDRNYYFVIDANKSEEEVAETALKFLQELYTC